MTKIRWEIPIKTVSELNSSEHWKKKWQRHKRQQYFVSISLKKVIHKVSLPCTVTITRISPKSLDYDNLVCSQKWVVDAICDLLVPGLRAGRADADDRIKVDYAQEKGNILGIRIEIEFNP